MQQAGALCVRIDEDWHQPLFETREQNHVKPMRRPNNVYAQDCAAGCIALATRAEQRRSNVESHEPNVALLRVAFEP